MTAPAHTDLLTGQGAYREYLTRTARSLYVAARTEQSLGLDDVDPPYPPLGLEDDPTDPDVGIPAALAHLDDAAQAATSVRELTRYAVVALLLQQATGAVTP